MIYKIVDKGDVKDTQKENTNKKTTAKKGTNTKEAQKNPPQKTTTKSIAAKGGKNDADAQKNLAQDDNKIEKNAVIANGQDTKSKKLKKKPTG
ncbi:1673_t:CDS:2 [Rhizophagus irregularis]|nr:1673_t:CDS:2 [Rhizophagus irregularis]